MQSRLVILITVILSLVYQIRSSENECADYKCKCTTNSEKEIKCRFNNNTIKIVNLNLSPSVSLIDLSNNNLEQINFKQDSLQNKLERLLLGNNKLQTITEEFLAKLTELNELDLSNNNINLMQETAFKNLHSKLIKLNLSNAFASSFMLKRELCELVSLKTLDLSNLNLANFNLECWKNQPGQIEYLYLKNTQNIETSWSKWYPYIGTNLKLIDLTNSNLVTIDSNLSKQTNLVSLVLANNKRLEEASLFQVLQSDNLIGRLVELNLSGVISSNKTLTNLIDHSLDANLRLEHLDISNNNLTYDLNAFLFNQPKFKNLKTFRANKNKLKQCEQKLITIKNFTLLDKLEVLDLSDNSLEGSKCLYSIKTVTSLKWLDLSHNKLNMIDSDLPELVSLFELMLNVSTIDLSHNMFSQLSFFFNPYHTKINKFDASYNQLKSFRFVSLHSRESVKFPFNLKENFDYETNSEEEDEDDEFAIDNKHFKNENEDDDERFLILDKLDLSHNLFKAINLQHMLQSVRNVKQLDLSSNRIEQLRRFSNERDIIRQNEKVEQDDLTEILCIDLLDLSNCQIKYIPNLEHICINKLNFAYNQITGNTHLLMSNFSIYFTDYINLQYNNITKLRLSLSNQKFKQDLYLKKNSPNSYYFGDDTSIHNLVHTYVDLQNNRLFKCECDLIYMYKTVSYVQLLNECLNETKFKSECSSLMREKTDNSKITIYSLNRKFRILFVITCALLMILSALIVYYMCSDCVQNMEPYKTIRFNWKKLWQKIQPNSAQNNDESKIHYSKLQNDLTSSSNNINLDI